jgi:pimeloyl-ACP methyl ester carboxylesterase
MMMHWQRSLVFALFFAVFLLVAGCVYEWAGQRQDARLHPAPGSLVSVDGRRLHLLCRGSAAPTVVIEQGAGELARFWWPLQDEAAKFARVCTYDRAGYGWSDRASQGTTIEGRARQLHILLTNAAIDGPYIFVAHSYGGLIVRSYTEMYPDQVAGLILVDTPDESSIFQKEVLDFYAKVRTANRVLGLAAQFGMLRLLRHWAPLDRYGLWLTRPAEYSALCGDLASLERVPAPQRISKAPGTLGARPLVVITHGQAFPGPFAVLEKNWTRGQQRLAALSTDSVLIVAEKSNHMVQLDEPEVIVNAIRRVHNAVRGQSR